MLTEELPWEDGFFDYVHIRGLAAGVPENCWLGDHKNASGVLDKAFRVLKVGGCFEVVESLHPTSPQITPLSIPSPFTTPCLFCLRWRLTLRSKFDLLVLRSVGFTTQATTPRTSLLKRRYNCSASSKSLYRKTTYPLSLHKPRHQPPSPIHSPGTFHIPARRKAT